MTLNITAMDYFCGAGGSSTGLVAAGVEVRGAANHWDMAIKTHNTNHPKTEHFLDDLQQAHPSWYPHTTIAWFSPECTNHSLAKGKKRKGLGQLDLWGESGVDPAEEKSRATMREVVEFTNYHRYEVVIVENVVDIRNWQHYDAWLTAMLNMGYQHKILYLNAQFFGVPQSRDRFYAVFWKKGNRTPDLDFRPAAMCAEHGVIHAVQVFKKSEFPWGRYGARRQYLYRCPKCGHVVEPVYQPASSIIDWTLTSEMIGERKHALKEKTLKRVLAGLKKFGNWAHIADISHTHAADSGKVHSIDGPLPTETGQQRMALVNPFLLSYANQESPPRDANDVLFALTKGYVPRLVVPPFIASYHGDWDALKKLDEPLRTVTTFNHEHAMITPPFMVVLKNSHSADGKYTLPPREVTEPLTTLVGTAIQHYLVSPPFLASLNHSDVRNTPVDGPAPTIMPYVNPALVTPPFVLAHYNNAGLKTVDEPLPALTQVNHHSLVTPPFIAEFRGGMDARPIDEPLSTVTAGVISHGLVEPIDLGSITPEDLLPFCGFRMLEPHELKRGMSFPESYIILGNKRDQVQQIGNAVCPNVAQWIAERVMESLQ